MSAKKEKATALPATVARGDAPEVTTRTVVVRHGLDDWEVLEETVRVERVKIRSLRRGDRLGAQLLVRNAVAKAAGRNGYGNTGL